MVAPQPFFRARGTPFSVLHRVRALLADERNSVHLLTYPFGEDVPLDGLEITRCTRPFLVKDVAIGPSVAKALLDVNLYWLTASTLKSGSYDVIHSHEEAAFFCQRFSERYGIPHIYDMHSSLPQQLDNFSKFDFWPLRRVFERMESGVLERCDGVITICDELAQRAGSIVAPKPHYMIENTADDRKVFDHHARMDEVAARVNGARVVMYTGTLEKYQGLELLMHAFVQVKARVDDAHLLLVGGSEEQVEAAKSELRRLGIEGAATVTGTVHPAKIPALYELADVIVSPRARGTNTPLKIYSYLRSGRPIVATNLLTHTQTLDETNACLVDANAEGLSDGIVRVLSDDGYAEYLVRNATRKAEEEFSDEAYLRRVQAFFSEVMEPRALSAPQGIATRTG